MTETNFQFEISLSVLNHLGRNLYRNFITVLGEAISNSWDANANEVWIDIDHTNRQFSIRDDGDGMDANDFQNKFLKIGYSKRKDKGEKSRTGRPFIGSKGIGKLAMLSCAERVTIFSRKEEGNLVGGVIDNSGLDDAIRDDLAPGEYQLEKPDTDLIGDTINKFNHGTIIHFDGINPGLKNSTGHIRKLLALSFRFSLIDDQFKIFLNGDPVGIDDIRELISKTEFFWCINKFSDKFTEAFDSLQAKPVYTKTSLGIKGFIATVVKPRHLKISGTDERASVDLFVNGRLREKNILRHIPTQRIVENYIYGQIHFDAMDEDSRDPFTSSREGIIEDDPKFTALLDYLKKDLFPKIIDEWDALRLGRGEEGDEENNRKSKKQRKARDLYNLARSDYHSDPDAEDADVDIVENWMSELQDDAEYNLSAYADCFLAENLVRKFIFYRGIKIPDNQLSKIRQYRKSEDDHKAKANISFDIRRDDLDLSYCDMDVLAVIAEGQKKSEGASLWLDAKKYKPARNAVGHTGVLTNPAKNDLSTTLENIKARVKRLLGLIK